MLLLHPAISPLYSYFTKFPLNNQEPRRWRGSLNILFKIPKLLNSLLIYEITLFFSKQWQNQ